MSSPLPHVIRLSSILDMEAAASLATSLARVRGGDLDLDGSAVERLSGPSLQTLLCAAKTWKSDGFRLCFREPSATLVLALATAGAVSFFEQTTPVDA